MAIDATPGSPTANSYVSIAGATVYLAERLHVEPWYQHLPTTEGYGSLAHLREAALIWATSLIDSQVRWLGQPTFEGQALAWPMTGYVDTWGNPVDDATIPANIQRATAYYALALLRDTTEAPGATTSAVRRKKIGALEIEYQQQTSTTLPKAAHLAIPSEVRALLAPYGYLRGGVTIPLLRT